MNKPLLSLGFGLVLSLSVTSTAFAVQSAPITENSKIEWSRVVEDPFDGTVMYDKHFANEFAFISSWSKQGIRATYTQKEFILTGYRTTWRTRWVPDYACKYENNNDCKDKQKMESYSTQDPVYKVFYSDRIPRKILFAIADELYTYESGLVSPELASALSTAPAQNMRVRLEWQDEGTTDMEIGKGTVKAWKTVFKLQK